MPCDIYQRPKAFDVDYGVPTELCHETAENSGVFQREWTRSTVTVISTNSRCFSMFRVFVLSLS